MAENFNVPKDVIEAIQSGNKFEAINLLVKNSNYDLVAAKQLVEALQDYLGIEPSDSNISKEIETILREKGKIFAYHHAAQVMGVSPIEAKTLVDAFIGDNSDLEIAAPPGTARTLVIFSVFVLATGLGLYGLYRIFA